LACWLCALGTRNLALTGEFEVARIVLERLHIQDFRGLRELTLSGLTRVNLLVGSNNCGKTSILEAIHILGSRGHVGPLWNVLARRGEFREGADEREVDASHLIHGRELVEDVGFRISGRDGEIERRVEASIVSSDEVAAKKRDLQLELTDVALSASEILDQIFPFELRLKWTGSKTQTLRWPLTKHSGLALQNALDDRGRPAFHRSDDGEDESNIELVSVDGLVPDRITELYDAITLTPEEGLVTEALRAIEPTIERIALARMPRRGYRPGSRAGIRILLGKQRVPIGSMGDGMWRLLGIALASVGAKNGLLLIDEIDTGLHYSVLTKMWRLVLETARRLDVQVFATSHSRDCVEALAEITQDDRHDISLQRIERDNPCAIAFTEAELHRAAERGLEVR
jgi:hypothetical protein